MSGNERRDIEEGNREGQQQVDKGPLRVIVRKLVASQLYGFFRNSEVNPSIAYVGSTVHDKG